MVKWNMNTGIKTTPTYTTRSQKIAIASFSTLRNIIKVAKSHIEIERQNKEKVIWRIDFLFRKKTNIPKKTTIIPPINGNVEWIFISGTFLILNYLIFIFSSCFLFIVISCLLLVCFVSLAIWTVKLNLEPLPFSDSTQILPPWSSIIDLQI